MDVDLDADLDGGVVVSEKGKEGRKEEVNF